MKAPSDISTTDSPETKIPDEFFRVLHIELLIHELKDPLSLIEAGVRTLLERKGGEPLSARQEKTLARVLRGALKGKSLVNHLLEIGRSEAGGFVITPFRPRAAVYTTLLESIETMEAELSERLKEQKTEEDSLAVLNQAGITLEVAPELEEIEIVQDPIKFGLIVGNLIKNALRFRRKILELSLRPMSGALAIEIRDDGPGIRPEHHALIFERYAQVEADAALDRKGHGLGLAGALILARRTGGDIAVYSEPGQGTTFRFTLPLALNKVSEL